MRADRKPGITDLTRLQPLAGIFASIFLLVYGATTLYLVAQIDEEISANLAGGIGASQYPWLVSVALIVGAVLLLFASICDMWRRKVEVANAAARFPFKIILFLFGAFVFYFTTFLVFGYALSTFFFGMLVLLIAGQRNVGGIFLFSGCLTLAIYWLIRLLFNIHLPLGRLFEPFFGY